MPSKLALPALVASAQASRWVIVHSGMRRIGLRRGTWTIGIPECDARKAWLFSQGRVLLACESMHLATTLEGNFQCGMRMRRMGRRGAALSNRYHAGRNCARMYILLRKTVRNHFEPVK